MSFNVGLEQSKFVYVSNPTIRFAFSDKVVFAKPRTSSKTGRNKVDDKGNEILDADNNTIPERKYSTWEGRFVGEAFEAAKAFKKPTAINIIAGWIDTETFNNKTSAFVTISDFSLCDEFINDSVDDENPPADAKGAFTDTT
jgi:hypothetical protein